MKSLEILQALPKWEKAHPEQLIDSSAFAMPCRLGDASATLRREVFEVTDTLDLAVLFGDEPHTLRLARAARFAELDKIWESRADVPEPILLALAEKDCGALFQLLENVVRRQFKIVSLAAASADDEPSASCGFRVEDVFFSLSRSDTVVAALGNLRHLDLSHPSLRAETLPAETEYAAFVLSAADLASLAVGDALLLPEIGSLPARLVVDGRFVADRNGVSPFANDGRCRVVAVEPRTVTLGELFDAAEGSAAEGASVEVGVPPAQTPLRLVLSGREVASGRLDRLGDQNAFVVESTSS